VSRIIGIVKVKVGEENRREEEEKRRESEVLT